MTCSSSGSYDYRYTCDKTIDEDLSSEWATKKEQVGAWIKFDFDQYYQLSKTMIMHRTCRNCGRNQMFKEISFSFSDGTTEKHTLKEETGKVWNEVILRRKPTTNFVNITATSVYKNGRYDNGFSEIAIFKLHTGIEILSYLLL